LREADRVLVPVDPTHRVFLVRALKDRGSREIAWRARFLPADEIDGTGAIMPVATMFSPQHVDVTKLVSAMRPRVVAGSSLTAGTCDGKRVLLCGLSDEVAAAIAVLRELDVAKK
jgi:hypothetical protein